MKHDETRDIHSGKGTEAVGIPKTTRYVYYVGGLLGLVGGVVLLFLGISALGAAQASGPTPWAEVIIGIIAVFFSSFFLSLTRRTR
ncbi:MAG: hypothetical protein GTO55_03575 [Armatimonadetes bacterium]|nr:hypothetical protein [Armatimonadota bacterium]NIM23355.1 hypothetical protein [Armatimonadota bacterium]NIM67219.1 hypothetical protein [Armatimonadota bacterium]NIN05406.1 hypothetical protein [Armatimonadota bacterium]NIO96539.1 hypothetical protein [Armatimonadota bacterium]